ncbi:MAG: LysM peptidoglycan-binding domain-containing protein [Flavobacteriia bacterium]|nr:LysM peptidoglycan-binding domain-containing protein [Flavobacteriia bacterium]
MCLKKGLSMKTISENLNWDLQQIKDLNPIYKTEFIPASEKKRCVTGPLDRILLLVAKEDTLYKIEHKNQNSSADGTKPNGTQNNFFAEDSIVGNEVFHKVKLNETLPLIAEKYKVSTSQILEWNALQTPNLYVGQRLLIRKNAQSTVVNKPVTPKPTPKKPTPKPASKAKKYHVVKSGESLGKIAAKYKISIAQLKKLNPGKGNTIRTGDKIRIK